MEPFRRLTSRLVPLPETDVDTDQITPARFLKRSLPPGGYGEILFHDWRYDESGAPRGFVLDRPERAGARILVAGDNFGCGSSRETAVWALAEHGFRAVVSTSFGDIFRTNCLKNGLLPAAVPEAALTRLLALAKDPAAEVTVDLESCRIELPPGEGGPVPFPVDPFYRECLLAGLDQMGWMLARLPEIEAYEARAGKLCGPAVPASQGSVP